MANNNLEVLLTEYEEKRRIAEIEFDRQVEKIYKKFPRLEQIETEINKIAINKTRAALNHESDLKKYEEQLKNLKQEKERILKIEKIDLERKYDCDFCKDTGYIKTENDKTIMCNCLKQKLLNLSYNRSNLSDVRKENFKNFNLDIFSDEGKRSPRKNINMIKKAALEFIDNFDNLETKNLLFYRKYRTWKDIYVKLYSK